MYPLEVEVRRLTLPYARKGSKANRAIQRSRMLAFAQFAAGQMGARQLGQVGQRHVNAFWATTVAQRAERTRYFYWLAITELFELAGKQVPKRPEEPGEKPTKKKDPTTIT